MLIYLLIPILLFIFRKSINEKKFTIPDYIILLLLILICGLRENVGTDFKLYSKIYDNILAFPRIEFLFANFIKLLNYFNLSLTTFFTLVSYITIALVYKTIKEQAEYPFESLFIYISLGFYALQFNIIRQMLALAITLYAIKFLKDKNLIKYMACILIAGLCHTTAFIMIPIYFLANLKLSKIHMYIILVVFLFLSFLYEPLLKLAATILPRYSDYLIQNVYTFNQAGIGTYVILISNLILMIILIQNKDKLITYNSDNRKLINIVLFSLLFYFMSLNNTVMVRPGYFMFVYVIFLLPDLYRVSRFKVNDRNTIVFAIFLVIYYVAHLISFNVMLPYHSVWF